MLTINSKKPLTLICALIFACAKETPVISGIKSTNLCQNRELPTTIEHSQSQLVGKLEMMLTSHGPWVTRVRRNSLVTASMNARITLKTMLRRELRMIMKRP